MGQKRRFHTKEHLLAAWSGRGALRNCQCSLSRFCSACTVSRVDLDSAFTTMFPSSTSAVSCGPMALVAFSQFGLKIPRRVTPQTRAGSRSCYRPLFFSNHRLHASLAWNWEQFAEFLLSINYILLSFTIGLPAHSAIGYRLLQA